VYIINETESFEELLLFSVIFTRPQKCCVMVSMLTLNVVDPWVLAPVYYSIPTGSYYSIPTGSYYSIPTGSYYSIPTGSYYSIPTGSYYSTVLEMRAGPKKKFGPVKN
jgi:hypothetical protein